MFVVLLVMVVLMFIRMNLFCGCVSFLVVISLLFVVICFVLFLFLFCFVFVLFCFCFYFVLFLFCFVLFYYLGYKPGWLIF